MSAIFPSSSEILQKKTCWRRIEGKGAEKEKEKENGKEKEIQVVTAVASKCVYYEWRHMIRPC